MHGFAAAVSAKNQYSKPMEYGPDCVYQQLRELAENCGS